MVATMSQFPKLLETNIRKYFFDVYNDMPKEYPMVFNVVNATTANVYDHSTAGLGAATPKSEGTGITYQDLTDGYDKTYTPAMYGIGFRSTYEMMKNDQSGIIKKAAGQLGRSCNLTVETYAWSVFNNGFTSTTGEMDSTYLFSTAHPSPVGGTYSNRPTTGTDFSETSLKVALQHFDDILDDRGYHIIVRPKYLIVPTALRWAAQEVLETDTGLYTDEGTINVLKSGKTGLSMFVGHFLTDSNAWFLATDKADHQLQVVFREQPSFDRSDDFDTGDSKWRAFVWFDYGNSGWRGVYGNPGSS